MKKYQHLTQRQRFIIQDMFSLGKSAAEISAEVGVHRTTISREIKRNSNQKGGYKALGAQRYYLDRRPPLLDRERKISGVLQEIIEQKLSLGWSPEQISGRLRREGSWSISHESIYSWIYRIAPDYISALRHKSKRRRGLKKRRRSLGKLPRKYIDQRPLKADLRSEKGHWERDLVEGRRSGPSLLVLNDRKSRYTRIKKVQSHFSNEVSNTTKNLLKKMKVLTLTNDNGVEFGQYQDLEKQLQVPIYFTDPYTSWQRGTVENTNGLIRQYYPKKTDFSKVDNESIAMLENSLNHRPRKMHNFKTCYEKHFSKKTKLVMSKSTYLKHIRQRMIEEEIEYWKHLYKHELCT